MNNPFLLEDKHILITGASSGIGRQCAISCSKMGAKVILIDRDSINLEETIRMLAGEGHENVSQDITQYDAIESIISSVVSRHGKIHGFIHSAGIEMTLPLKMLDHKKIEQVFSVNVIAGLEFSKILSKKKYIAENASFVFISSIMAILGQSGKVAYCASKGAISAASKAMALELAGKNIRVNSILPGMVKSEMSIKLLESLSSEARDNIEKMHPLGIGGVEDVANACIFLLSDASKWVTGSNLIVDGGYSAK